MTTHDDRETLQKVIDAMHQGRFLSRSGMSADDYRDVPALLSSLRSALQVPDAAQAAELFDVRAMCGDALCWARQFDDSDGRSVFPGEALRSARALAHEYAKAQEEMRSMRETIRSKVLDAAQVRRETIEECARVVMSARVATRLEARDAIRALAAQPAARGEKENDKPEADALSACSRNPSQQAGRHAHTDTTGREPPPAPPPLDDAAVPSDAEMLCAKCRHRKGEHGCDTIRAYEEGWMTLCECECHQRASEYLHPLRQPPEPEPDVFVLAASTIFLGRPEIPNNDVMDVADFLREKFGPLVKALETIATMNDGPLDGPALARRECASKALAQLRARVGKGASK